MVTASFDCANATSLKSGQRAVASRGAETAQRRSAIESKCLDRSSPVLGANFLEA